MPAPKSRFLQVSGRVGTLQPAVRHSLDIDMRQRQYSCLLGTVPCLTMATPSRLLQVHWYYIGQIPQSIICHTPCQLADHSVLVLRQV